MKYIAMAATVFAALPMLASAHDYKAGDLQIAHPMAYETPPSARTGGGYLTITNDGDEADALIGVKADFPKVMIHQSAEKDGIATMRHVERLEIPPGKTVELAPGSYHVMFMGLSEQLAAGSEFPATLVFETAGEVPIVFHVEKRGEGAGAHSH